VTYFWIGAYTDSMAGTATGIGLARSRADGSLEFLREVAEVSSPSFLAESARGIVYATDEAGRIEAFGRGPDFTLEPLGGKPTSGAFPCHVTVTDSALLVSNYGGGSVDVFALLPDGRIGELTQTVHGAGSGPNPAQEAPHAHSTAVRGNEALSADLGTDQVHLFRFADAALERRGATVLPPGTGPRDFLRHGASTIVLGELSGALFALDAQGTIVRSGALATEWQPGDHAAALAIDTSSTWLYSGMRGSNRIAIVRAADLGPVASVDLPNGPDGGDWPRHLLVVGELLHVVCQLSNRLATYRIDSATGVPTLLGTPEPVASPTFLLPVM
jgi:6-phosphogluconolactonase